MGLPKWCCCLPKDPKPQNVSSISLITTQSSQNDSSFRFDATNWVLKIEDQVYNGKCNFSSSIFFLLSLHWASINHRCLIILLSYVIEPTLRDMISK